MASEIQSTQNLTVAKGSLRVTKSVSNRYDMAGDNYAAGTIELTTAPDLLSALSPLGTLGWAWFANLSDDATIEVGILEDIEYGGRFWAFLSLPPGAQCHCPLYSSNDLAAQAASGTARLEFLVVER